MATDSRFDGFRVPLYQQDCHHPPRLALMHQLVLVVVAGVAVVAVVAVVTVKAEEVVIEAAAI